MHDDHISRISTLWTVIRQAHGDDAHEGAQARERLLERYSGAIYRYLLAVLREADAADEVFQEFALQFIKGGYRGANREKGRFRDYLKISILRLVGEYRRRRSRREGVEAPLGDPAGAEPGVCDEALDQAFIDSCRDNHLHRAWEGLQSIEARGQQPYHTVLRCRVQHPSATSEQLAEELTRQLQPSEPLNAAGVRKLVQRAREKFADLLLDSLFEALDQPTPQALEQELIDLGLQPYCGHAFTRRYRWE